MLQALTAPQCSLKKSSTKPKKTVAKWTRGVHAEKASEKRVDNVDREEAGSASDTAERGADEVQGSGGVSSLDVRSSLRITKCGW